MLDTLNVIVANSIIWSELYDYPEQHRIMAVILHMLPSFSTEVKLLFLLLLLLFGIDLYFNNGFMPIKQLYSVCTKKPGFCLSIMCRAKAMQFV